MRFLPALIALGLGCVPLRAATDYFPLEEVKPGMRGTTMTVLQGRKIEPVETEILGVAKNFLGPGMDLIIGKLVDPKTALSGAVHGMSGSPLYINGKMAGALSRRIAFFEKEGHCGFTPIRDMLDVDRRTTLAESAPPRWKLPLLASSLPESMRVRTSVESVVECLSVPLGISGVSPVMLERLLQRFGLADRGFAAVSGGGGSDKVDPNAANEMQPGAALAAVMMTGDVNMAGTGTLTWREGNRILGFGHPMFAFGASNIPMATADIIATIPSYQRPYKLANSGTITGTITQDRASAIGGVIGKILPMASYRIERTHNGEVRKALTGTFVPHPVLNPMMIAGAIVGSLTESNDSSRVFSLAIKGQLKLKGQEPLQIDGVYGGEDSELVLALFDVLSPVMMVYGQNWQLPEPESLNLSITTGEKLNVWTIDSIRTDARRYERGGKVRVLVDLSERYGKKDRREVLLTLPENLKGGGVDVRVSGAQGLDDKLFSQNAGALRDLPQLISILNKRQRSNDRLYVQLVTAASGQAVEDRQLSSLPPSVGQVMNGGNSTQERPSISEQVWQESAVEIPGVMQGNKRLRIEIRP